MSRALIFGVENPVMEVHDDFRETLFFHARAFCARQQIRLSKHGKLGGGFASDEDDAETVDVALFEVEFKC